MQHEEHIRRRAYEIWEAEGRPVGREAEHWEQARREIAGDGAGGESYADDTVVTHEPSGTTTVAEHATGAVPTDGPPPPDASPQRAARRS